MAVCLIFYLDEAGGIQPFVEALAAEGVDAESVYNKGVPDWHIYAHWKHLMEKKPASERGGPWTHPAYVDRGGKAQYSPDMCPNMLKYLERSVQLHIPPQMTDEDCGMIVKGIAKVAHALQAGEIK